MTDADTKGLNLNRQVTQNIRTIVRYNLRRSSPSRLVAHDPRRIATMMISRFRRRSENSDRFGISAIHLPPLKRFSCH
jgi:hypothetical protein